MSQSCCIEKAPLSGGRGEGPVSCLSRKDLPSSFFLLPWKLAPHPAPTLQPPVARRAATGRTDWGPVALLLPSSFFLLPSSFRSFGFELQGPCSAFTSWRARIRGPQTLALPAHE